MVLTNYLAHTLYENIFASSATYFYYISYTSTYTTYLQYLSTLLMSWDHMMNHDGLFLQSIFKSRQVLARFLALVTTMVTKVDHGN